MIKYFLEILINRYMRYFIYLFIYFFSSWKIISGKINYKKNKYKKQSYEIIPRGKSDKSNPRNILLFFLKLFPGIGK